jgi:hypothetical protein
LIQRAIRVRRSVYDRVIMEGMRKSRTDERLDDLAVHTDRRFDEVGKRFDRVDHELARINDRLDGLQRVLLQTHVVLIAGLIGLIGTQL